MNIKLSNICYVHATDTVARRLVLLMGLIIGTCAVAAWTAIFSSSMVGSPRRDTRDVRIGGDHPQPTG